MLKAIRILSDLHLERAGQYTVFKKYALRSQVRPTHLALLGDIGDPGKDHYRDFLYEQADNYQKVLVIAGNHEYFYKSYRQTNDLIKDVCDSRDNLSFLNNKVEKLFGRTILGTTLWTKKRNRLHQESLDFLKSNLGEAGNIVLSHHAPSFKCVKDARGRYVFKNGALVKDLFASDLEHLFGAHITHWCYGHTHIPFNTKVKDTMVVSNPFGYQQIGFNYDLVIELEGDNEPTRQDGL